ncbi:hypothetical protein M0R72_06475 [Candidatus Pacearchaeota archaeon]|jgi:hypothetical protein|nr:hypothetical protein [Candidatus Pacearchaeota archaeon]
MIKTREPDRSPLKAEVSRIVKGFLAVNTFTVKVSTGIKTRTVGFFRKLNWELLVWWIWFSFMILCLLWVIGTFILFLVTPKEPASFLAMGINIMLLVFVVYNLSWLLPAYRNVRNDKT